MTAVVSPDLSPRHDVLDLLRGVAVLGILVVNIWAFALPYAAYDNPNAYGDLQGLNFWAWWLAAVFAQEKFITLFSVLFGTGMALFKARLDQQPGVAAARHYRRMFGLLLFGVLHAYLLWFGDILTIYAICGMLLYPLLSLSWRWLLLIVLGLFAIEYSMLYSMTYSLQQLSPEALQSMQEHWQPSAALLQEEIAAYRGDWHSQMLRRVPDAWDGEWATLLFYGPRLCGQMLLGVLLYRTGWIVGRYAAVWYSRLGAVTFLSGLVLVLIGVQRSVDSEFAFADSLLMGNYWNSAGSLLMAAGYASLIIRWSQRANPGMVQHWLRCTGRMAFSNYLLMSLLCTSLFYGHGLAWFGQMDRLALLAVTLAVWAVLISFSVFWLQHFRSGPLEWCWRWLTYGERSRLRLNTPSS